MSIGGTRRARWPGKGWVRVDGDAMGVPAVGDGLIDRLPLRKVLPAMSVCVQVAEIVAAVTLRGPGVVVPGPGRHRSARPVFPAPVPGRPSGSTDAAVSGPGL